MNQSHYPPVDPIILSDQFPSLVKEAGHRLIERLATDKNITPVLEQASVPLYVKNSTGQVLASNKLNLTLFGSSSHPVGRFSQDFLNQTIRPVSLHTDALIMAGCPYCDCTHKGRDDFGHSVLFRTVKVSLLGHGNSQFALVGSTSIAAIMSNSESTLPTLHDAMDIFRSFENRDQEIAKLLSFGKSAKEISESLSVSKKTIELRRSHILNELQVANSNELTKLFVRLQDQGLYDFGH